MAQNLQERPFVDKAKLLDLSDIAGNLSALWSGRRRESLTSGGSEKSVRKALAKQSSSSALRGKEQPATGSGSGKKDAARYLPSEGWQQQADNDRAIAQLKQNLHKALQR